MPDERDTGDEPHSFADLPIQPTGSGVQDLEVAYEQMKLSEGDVAPDAAISPTDDSDAALDSAAHPS
ncbi:hypothetical protein M9979_06795 [Sphingomonas sp. RP10(2022)]|uniref:Uncharacterized protein n=1 Tax=Sphingomonas liriopis TaxID=2949094 RepID=A0A9X2HNT8_9SPHN|nr:hypothetical protein [Sphingomonas liriopis]MCP3734581.1 hypothetical protein [Sphingomonas liriopis]